MLGCKDLNYHQQVKVFHLLHIFWGLILNATLKGFLSLGLNLPILAAFQKIPNNLSKRKRKIPLTDQFMQIVPFLRSFRNSQLGCWSFNLLHKCLSHNLLTTVARKRKKANNADNLHLKHIDNSTTSREI